MCPVWSLQLALKLCKLPALLLSESDWACLDPSVTHNMRKQDVESEAQTSKASTNRQHAGGRGRRTTNKAREKLLRAAAGGSNHALQGAHVISPAPWPSQPVRAGKPGQSLPHAGKHLGVLVISPNIAPLAALRCCCHQTRPLAPDRDAGCGRLRPGVLGDPLQSFFVGRLDAVATVMLCIGASTVPASVSQTEQTHMVWESRD